MNKLKEKLLKKTNITNNCWEWVGRKDKDGYGLMYYNTGIKIEQRAHRISYIAYKGEIPQSLLVCHHCDNPSCVNPDHLFLGTVKDNTVDAKNKGRLIKGEKQRKLMSERQSGEKNSFHGRKHSKSSKSKMSKYARQRKWPENHKKKISRALKKLNRRGERCPTAKLTEAEVIEIKKLLFESTPISKIAERYHVGNGTIWAIKYKKTWKYLGKSREMSNE